MSYLLTDNKWLSWDLFCIQASIQYIFGEKKTLIKESMGYQIFVKD